MGNKDVPAWVGIVTAILGLVYLTEKVTDKAICIWERLGADKKHPSIKSDFEDSDSDV